MLAATGSAIAALLLARLTVIGPGAALHSSLAVAATGLVPTTVVRINPTDSIPIGRTESLRVRTVPPKFAVIVPLCSVVTGFVLMENVIVVAPPGTVTLAGVVAEGNVSAEGDNAAACRSGIRELQPTSDGLAPCNDRLIEAQRA